MLMPVMMHEVDPKVLGFQVDDKVYVPEDFCLVSVFPASSFVQTDRVADVLDTFYRDAKCMGDSDCNKLGLPGTFRHYGSTLGWALKNARPAKKK